MTRPFPVSGYLLFLLVAVFIAYLPGLHAPFLFDDFPNIVLNDALHPQTFGEITRALDSPFSANRPVSLASFAANYLYSGLSASSYRIWNIVIHSANTLLIFTISYLLLGHRLAASRKHLRLIAFWAAMLWAVNPTQTQAVTFIVQRMTSLATLFYLLAILSYILLRTERISQLAGALLIGIFFLLGMGSKQIVASLPGALLLIEFLFFRQTLKPTRRDIIVALGLLALAIIYLALKHPISDWTQNYPNRDFSPLERLITQPRVLLHYLSLLVFPEISRLHLDYALAPSRGLLTPPSTLPALLAVISLITAGILLAKRLVFASLAILFFLLGSVIEGSFLNLELVFIHRAYLPSAFVYLGALSLIPEQRYHYFTPVIISLFAFFTYNTYERNIEWANGEVMWEKELERGASEARSRINLSANRLVQGKYQQSIQNLLTVLDEEGKLRSKRSYTHFTVGDINKMQLLLGQSYFLSGQHEDAVRVLQHLIEQSGATEARYYLWMSRLSLDPGVDLSTPLEQIRKQENYPFYSCLLEAQQGYLTKRYGYAEQTLLTCLDTIPAWDVLERNTLLMYIANIKLTLEDYQAARNIYRDIVTSDSENLTAWAQLYRMSENANDKENAQRIRRYLENKGYRID